MFSLLWSFLLFFLSNYSPTASEYSGCLSPVTPFGPGVVQPFDTCLVPLDDVTPSGAPRAMGTHGTAGPHVTSRAAPAIRPNNLAIRPRVDFSPERSRFRWDILYLDMLSFIKEYCYCPNEKKALTCFWVA